MCSRGSDEASEPASQRASPHAPTCCTTSLDLFITLAHHRLCMTTAQFLGYTSVLERHADKHKVNTYNPSLLLLVSLLCTYATRKHSSMHTCIYCRAFATGTHGEYLFFTLQYWSDESSDVDEQTYVLYGL